jgi:SET domain-containing protein
MVAVRTVPGKGRGVFALKEFQAGDLIERSPVIVLSEVEYGHIKKTILEEYYYDWNKDDASRAIVLGAGSLYNHSYQPNARYARRFEEREMDFIALRPIAEGEEVCVNYNGIIDDMSEVWFAVVS